MIEVSNTITSTRDVTMYVYYSSDDDAITISVNSERHTFEAGAFLKCMDVIKALKTV